MVVPFREEMAKRHLKPTGDLGKVIFMVRLRHTSPISVADSLVRNMISETLPHWKKAFGIRTLSTILLEGTTRPSTITPNFGNALVES